MFRLILIVLLAGAGLVLLGLTLAVLLGGAGLGANSAWDKGLAAYKKGDYATALREWQPLAEQGVAKAQYNLGGMHYKGEGVPQDYKKAAQWHRRAAEQGYADAQYNLGVMYYQGQGVPQDDQTAAQWYRRVAEQGHADAQFNLGVMHARGQGVAQDDQAAAQWYRRAAEQGHAGAQNNLGGDVLYRKRHGTRLCLCPYVGAHRRFWRRKRFRQIAILYLAESY